ncbi:transcriptional regulator [Ectopseudomonas khazarica]|uniref:transcriptional regulator n=1 Tax=Ectopseudomonas khazarica TaxID=2502979 RepID=UPI0037CBEFB6
MNQSQPSQGQSLIPQPEVCRRLGKTHSGLAKLRKKDPTFPKPIKFSEARQAAAYYVAAEVEAWLQSKIQARDAA